MFPFMCDQLTSSRHNILQIYVREGERMGGRREEEHEMKDTRISNTMALNYVQNVQLKSPKPKCNDQRNNQIL